MDLSDLNKVQREAVEYCDGASLIIAGAGSGKTRVLTYKIANLVDRGVPPSSIMALTFTNKAAKEMKERIAALVGYTKARKLWMGTFHSIFARILRDYADLIGYPSAFTIYDTSDSKAAIKRCIKDLKLDEQVYKPAEVLSRISAAKNYLVTAADYKNNADLVSRDRQHRKGEICNIYALYAKRCKEEGVMDFDDILLNMNLLFSQHPKVVEDLRGAISHVLVDEYQDTNFAQYRIVNIIAQKSKNITAVGDDSQSIYAFRGARIRNILNFKNDYPDVQTFRLEQNYRSTRTIVNAANSVIEHNHNRLKKECFSEGDEGEKIELIHCYDEQEEGASIASSIKRRIFSSKVSYDCFSILYRTNSQSRAIEEALRRVNIPYIIYAGHSFYERKEVKNLLAYFRLVLNPNDNEAFRRIVNVPVRGIGATTLAALSEVAKSEGMPLLAAVGAEPAVLAQYGLKDAAVAKLRKFAVMIRSFAAVKDVVDAYTLAKDIAESSGLMLSLQSDNTVEGVSALGNTNELLNGVKEFVEARAESEEADVLPSLSAYMENVALLTDSDNVDKEDENNRVKLMTIHSSKGLEFPYVYIAGMEDNLFPSMMSAQSSESIEEERRLFYVALTRAEKHVTLSYADTRFINGKRTSSPPSRFVREIDARYVNGAVDVGGGGVGMSDSGASGFRSERFRLAESGGFGNNAYRNREGTIGSPVSAPVQPQHAPKHLKKISSPEVRFTSAKPEDLQFSVGDLVRHDRFGDGKIVSLAGKGGDVKAVVSFDTGGEKTLLLKYAKLTKRG